MAHQEVADHRHLEDLEVVDQLLHQEVDQLPHPEVVDPEVVPPLRQAWED